MEIPRYSFFFVFHLSKNQFLENKGLDVVSSSKVDHKTHAWLVTRT